MKILKTKKRINQKNKVREKLHQRKRNNMLHKLFLVYVCRIIILSFSCFTHFNLSFSFCLHGFFKFIRSVTFLFIHFLILYSLFIDIVVAFFFVLRKVRVFTTKTLVSSVAIDGLVCLFLYQYVIYFVVCFFLF